MTPLATYLGRRDLTTIWEHILAPETLGDVLRLDYGVVHRDHLLRSLVPLYLGRVAAFVITASAESAAAMT